MIAGLLRALFFLGLHRQEIGEAIYPEVVEILAETIAGGFERDVLKNNGLGNQNKNKGERP